MRVTSRLVIAVMFAIAVFASYLAPASAGTVSVNVASSEGTPVSGATVVVAGTTFMGACTETLEDWGGGFYSRVDTPSGEISAQGTTRCNFIGWSEITISVDAAGYEPYTGIIVDNFATTQTANVVLTPVVPVPASVELSPSSGPRGTVVTVTGSGYVAGETVVIRWDSGVQLAVGTASSTGTISTTVTIPKATSGTHQVVTTSSSGLGASADFTVTANGKK